jgi:cytochrome c oxidase assembly protein subunit 15
MLRPMPSSQKPVFLWLLVCCGMIFVMAVIGAVTRLTESGLSITVWEPVTGAVPPLTAEGWDKAFAAYRDIPQYRLLHHGMTPEEFKSIFFREWLHRLWGRLIGLAFALPYLWFLARRKLDKPLALKLAAILALGGLQGFIGWFMVQSGLEPDSSTHVSPYRLALHLGAALLIYALLLWTALGLRGWKPPQRNLAPALLAALLALTMTWGAFVAGHKAGFAYNTWPLMEGRFLPDEAWTLTPLWRNAFANTTLVQFMHRWLGPVTGALILAWVAARWRRVGDTASRRWLAGLGGMVVLQIALGVATLLTQVDIVLAALHQAGAIALLTLLLVGWRRSGV